MRQYNTKGQMLLHFVIFIAIFAVLFYLSFSIKNDVVSNTIKGEWQANFMDENVVPAETQLLKNDALAFNVGINVARSLAQSAGFDTEFTCGKHEGIALWNKKEEWCFPNQFENAALEAQRGFDFIDIDEFSDLQFIGTDFVGNGEEESIITRTATYTFENDFFVNLKYSFDEYEMLFLEARALVESCSNEANLKQCITRNKEPYWRLGLCDPQNVQNQDLSLRVATFCIQSPHNYHLPVGDEVQRPLKRVEYSVALDFSSVDIAPEFIEEFHVVKVDTTHYTISFRHNNVASYVLYYTNWPIAAQKQGFANDIFNTMPANLFTQKSIQIPVTQECSGNPKRCADVITFELEDINLVEEEYFFSLAGVVSNQESELISFVLPEQGATS
jgi:hypothetical protein